MAKLLAVKSPRWLGWVLLTFGGSLAIVWTFVMVVVALFADEPWGDVAGDLFAFWVLGVLAAIAGFRMLTRRGSTDLD